LVRERVVTIQFVKCPSRSVRNFCGAISSLGPVPCAYARFHRHRNQAVRRGIHHITSGPKFSAGHCCTNLNTLDFSFRDSAKFRVPSHTFCDVHCLRLATNLAIVDWAICTRRPCATHKTRFLVGIGTTCKNRGRRPCGAAALVRCSIARSSRRLTSSRPAAYAAGCRPSPRASRLPCTRW